MMKIDDEVTINDKYPDDSLHGVKISIILVDEDALYPYEARILEGDEKGSTLLLRRDEVC